MPLWPEVTLNFEAIHRYPGKSEHISVELKSLAQRKFLIVDCTYDIVRILMTATHKETTLVFVQSNWFAPALGYFLRITEKIQNIDKPITGWTYFSQVTGFTSLRPPPPPLPVTRQALGITVANSTSALRDEYHIKPLVAKGLIVTAVDPNSQAAEKKIMPGELIVEVAQEKMNDVGQFTTTLQKQKQAGRKFALVLVGTPDGDARFV